MKELRVKIFYMTYDQEELLSAFASGNTDNCEYLRCEEMLLLEQTRILEY